MDRIAVLLPCYNEEQTIGKVVSDAKRALPDARIYVYDNGSTDNTVRVAEDAGAEVRHEYVRGKGNVIRRMFREIDAECYIMADGDDTYPMEEAAAMAELVLEHGADMVVGDRLSSTYFKENKRPFHGFGNNLVRDSINRLFGCGIKDIMTGFRAFSYDFVKTFPVLSTGFEIETEMTIHAVNNRMQVENHVIEFRNRPEGSESKLNTYGDGIRILATILRLFRDYKPLGFFSVIAGILAFLAIVFVVPVFKDYLETGLVERFPTLIVCGFTMIAAIQSLFCGIMLNNLTVSQRREFEIWRNILGRRKDG